MVMQLAGPKAAGWMTWGRWASGRAPLKRPAQDLEDVALELRQLVEEQEAVVRQQEHMMLRTPASPLPLGRHPSWAVAVDIEVRTMPPAGPWPPANQRCQSPR